MNSFFSRYAPFSLVTSLKRNQSKTERIDAITSGFNQTLISIHFHFLVDNAHQRFRRTRKPSDCQWNILLAKTFETAGPRENRWFADASSDLSQIRIVEHSTDVSQPFVEHLLPILESAAQSENSQKQRNAAGSKQPFADLSCGIVEEEVDSNDEIGSTGEFIATLAFASSVSAHSQSTRSLRQSTEFHQTGNHFTTDLSGRHDRDDALRLHLRRLDFIGPSAVDDPQSK